MRHNHPFYPARSTILVLFLVSLGLPLLCNGQESGEVDADYSFVGGSRMQNGSTGAATISEQSNLLRCVISTPVGGSTLLRTGVEWQRYSFSSAPPTVALPNTLQSLSLVVGVDAELWGWLVRLDALPGFYGDFNDPTGRCFNMPFMLGGAYLVGEDLQWVVGVGVDVQRYIPVLPAAGVRWKVSDQWVVDAVLPRPRLEYVLNKTTTLYTGGEFRLGTYRVSSDFGSEHNNSSLNDALLDYTEIRVGAGAEIKAAASMKIDFEAGCMVYRQFDYYRANVTVGNDNGGAYGQIVVNFSF